MKKIILCCTMFLLSGCMSNTLSSYVNRPVSDVMAEMGGPPDFVYDTSATDRTYMWKDNRVINNPAEIDSASHADNHGRDVFSTTTIQPATQTQSPCTYVVFARKIKPDAIYPSDWVVTGFKNPPFYCE